MKLLQLKRKTHSNILHLYLQPLHAEGVNPSQYPMVMSMIETALEDRHGFWFSINANFLENFKRVGMC